MEHFQSVPSQSLLPLQGDSKGTEKHTLDKENSFNFGLDTDSNDPLKILDEIQREQTPVIEDKRRFTAWELMNQPLQEQDCLLDPILPRVGLVSLVGSSDTGKSMLLRQFAIDIVSHRTRFLAWALKANHFSVAMIVTEDGQSDSGYLLNKQASGMPEEYGKRLTISFAPENALEEAGFLLSEQKRDVLVVDAWGDVAGIDTKDNGKVRIVLNEWHKLAIKYQCLIIFLHHTGKSTDTRAPSKHNTIGAQSFEAKMRCLVELRKDQNDENRRHFCIVKGNLLSQEYKSQSYVLDFNTDTFRFTYADERTPIDELAYNDIPQVREKKTTPENYARAIQLQKEGHTLDSIAKQLNLANRGAVSKLLTAGKGNNWPVVMMP